MNLRMLNLKAAQFKSNNRNKNRNKIMKMFCLKCHTDKRKNSKKK